MRWPYVVKMLVRSESFRFAWQAASEEKTSSLGKLRWQGRDVFYRPGTSDPLVLYQVLLKTGTKAEYYVPSTLSPEVIVDIGSNIGASILYFRDLFPRAEIYGFEPHLETFEILRRNVENLPRVRIFNYGLSDANMSLTVAAPQTDFSGFSTRPSNAGGG